jgi:4-alpha-glucanotransferase
LLHPTSLPGGRLGDDAYAFVDWLAAAGVGWWQMLPLGPPDETRSPYFARSAFAGWTGLLAEPDAPVAVAEIERFVAEHPFWIGSWAAYEGLQALEGQVRFQREWSALRAYAAGRGVRFVGDMPIYVADSGADHEAWPELFREGVVAGVPPDLFAKNGQHWGNPIYDWHTMRATGFRWWVERFRRMFELVDMTRVDHFRGFVAYWSFPAHHKTARHGRWRRAPGYEVFETVRRELGALPVIAEDLGVITPAVERLRDAFGLPGMHVLQWGLPGNPGSPHRLENHRENGVVYTGTHDNDTARGWYESLSPAEREATGLDPAEPSWNMVELALSSRARLAVVPVQDLLGLGSEARMNTPGSAAGNWTWRLERGRLTRELARKLRRAIDTAGRLG